MKKAATVVLLVVFLLNVLGFYGVFVGLQFKYAQEANDELDNALYSEADVFTFKVPISMPYVTEGLDFERVSGEFERGGEVYRLVKQKFQNDTLYVVCVKDNNSKKINEAVSDYVKTFTDKATSTKQQSSKTQLPSFSKDFMTTGVVVESQTSGWNNAVVYGENTKNLIAFHVANLKYPPKIVSTL